MDRPVVMNIITDMNIGGAGKVLENFYSHCDYGKFEHWVVVPEGSRLAEVLLKKGPRVVSFEGLEPKSFSLKSIKPIKQLIKKIKPDIVHTHASLSSRIAASSIKNIKVLYTRHCVYEPTRFQKSILGRLMGRLIFALYADRAIAISPASMNNLTATGVPGEYIDVLMNGTEPLAEMTPEEKYRVKEELGLENDDFVFSMIGRLEDIKGHEYFIRAAAILKKKIKNVGFLIVGDGSIRKQLIQLSDSIDADVIFTGFMKDVSKAVNISDVIVNASYGTEASSLAIIEAMSLGKPVIASDYGGNPYQVEDGVTGIIVAQRDKTALAEAMEKMQMDRTLFERMAENSEHAYNTKFTAAIMASNIEIIYEKLVNGDV